VSYFDAAHFCNWLSEREGIPRQEWCYRPGDAEGTWVLVPDYLSRRGYRLPTVQEWEYAARANTTTDRYFGDNLTLSDDYSWHLENTGPQPEPIGRLRPNDFGLFDTIGNLEELCFNPKPTIVSIKCNCRSLRETGLCEGRNEAQKGGSFTGAKSYLTVRKRPKTLDDAPPFSPFVYVGFRLVKNER
jgi:formylglycine-generating enzyme required for sulfatase activity